MKNKYCICIENSNYEEIFSNKKDAIKEFKWLCRRLRNEAGTCTIVLIKNDEEWLEIETL